MDRAVAARSAAELFIAAIVARDGGAISSLMSPKAQGELLQSVRRWDGDVATAAEAASRVWAGAWTALFQEVRIDDVELDGGRATVTYRHPTYGRDPDDFFVLLEIDGRWLVDELAPDDDDEDDIPPWAFST